MLRLLTSAKSMVFLIVVLCVPLILIRSVLFTYLPLLDQRIGGKHGHKAQKCHVSQCLLVVRSTCLAPSPEARHPQVDLSLDDFNPRCLFCRTRAGKAERVLFPYFFYVVPEVGAGLVLLFATAPSRHRRSWYGCLHASEDHLCAVQDPLDATCY